MYKLAKTLIGTVALTLLGGLANAQDTKKFPGIGRAATPAEVAAWDIDVRPDFKGLPKGSGTAEQGQELWEAKCASCHGVFGESNEVFTPIVGGTTAKDIKTGRVASLTDPNQPQRSTLMRLSTLSSLYDYVYRAMPWNAPRSLSADETYARSCQRTSPSATRTSMRYKHYCQTVTAQQQSTACGPWRAGPTYRATLA